MYVHCWVYKLYIVCIYMWASCCPLCALYKHYMCTCMYVDCIYMDVVYTCTPVHVCEYSVWMRTCQFGSDTIYLYSHLLSLYLHNRTASQQLQLPSGTYYFVQHIHVHVHVYTMYTEWTHVCMYMYMYVFTQSLVLKYVHTRNVCMFHTNCAV